MELLEDILDLDVTGKKNNLDINVGIFKLFRLIRSIKQCKYVYLNINSIKKK